MYVQCDSVFGDRSVLYLPEALKYEVDVLDDLKMEAGVLELVNTLLQ